MTSVTSEHSRIVRDIAGYERNIAGYEPNLTGYEDRLTAMIGSCPRIL